jgi:ubiquinone/menaquinone biosynthesis C-methylase UbiE
MKQSAGAQFEAWADTYDRSLLHHFLFEPSYVVLMEEIARWYHEHQPESFTVMDVGCGTGTLAGYLARSGWPVRVVGLDYAEGMCIQAADKARRAGLDDRLWFLRGDSEHLPMESNSVDVLTCSNSFHHYPHQQTVIEEMHRVLRPNGRLVLIDGFRDNIIGWFVFDVVITKIEGDVRHAEWREIDQYFNNAGFRNIRRRLFNFWFPALTTTGDKISASV